MKKIWVFLTLAVCLTLSGFKTPDKQTVTVFAGDSITDGAWGGSNGTKIPASKRNLNDLNHIYGHSYMMLCASQLQADYPTQGLVFHNRGISGNTLADLEQRWQDDILALHPDVISILIGTNDVHIYLAGERDEEFDYDGWEKRFRNLLDKAREQNPDVKFMIGTPFTAKSGETGKRDDFEERREMIGKLDMILNKTTMDYDAQVIRYDTVFEETMAKYPDVPVEYWIWDGIHPTPAGHRLMADTWIDAFCSLFNYFCDNRLNGKLN
ncbi:MAG: lipase [Paramuribaculum sp.]|nr:lipase [Paramuribaculum sp.]